ncbi:unnamed protein product [Bursaphelenchus okinawaensis]|uniref:Flavin-containing monooxygenase n=1 Tax=Bursaphelenchus okinawaensis TaxID=465554 RepID=A0A811JPR4_9BILA|nr:unnamed protein product [Bursaphelenchus okinawaensis]CAG9076908.1 unnamed protein product [Bursaphelenchus okinawaensis]
MCESNQKRCAIIGAGVSGLPSARWAKEYGYEPVIFEVRDNVGGLWYYQDKETEFSCVMKKTIMNTSKEMSAFSDFPPPADTPWFMTNRRMHSYLTSYAEHHNLLDYCRFKHKVTKVERTSDYANSGEWNVEYIDGNDNANMETFQAVLICTGRQSIPYMPKQYPGQNEFEGTIIHSKNFKEVSKFANKNVLIVGLGNSGTDAASEISQVAKKCYLSTRRGAWILHRTINGQPNDFYSNRRIMGYVKKVLGEKFHSWMMEKVFTRCFDHTVFGLKPQHRACNQNPILICDELQLRLAAGQVVLKPAISSFTKTSVNFQDGSTALIDDVVFCTGFSYSFEYLEDGKLIPTDEGELRLWKNMFPLSLLETNKQSLAVIGMLQLSGAIMCAMEMQARVFFEMNAGNIKLPPIISMTQQVDQEVEKRKAQYLHARASCTKVSYIDYMRDLANLIGCYANPMKMVLKDPYLAYRLVFHPDLPYSYRLVGPHKWRKARETICTVDQRMKQGLQNGMGQSVKNEGLFCKKQYSFSYIISLTISSTLLFVLFKTWISYLVV